MEEDTEDVQIGAAVSPELKREIRVEAARRDRTMSDIIRQATEEWLGEYADDE
jgi:hypothetical protein